MRRATRLPAHASPPPRPHLFQGGPDSAWSSTHASLCGRDRPHLHKKGTGGQARRTRSLQRAGEANLTHEANPLRGREKARNGIAHARTDTRNAESTADDHHLPQRAIVPRAPRHHHLEGRSPRCAPCLDIRLSLIITSAQIYPRTLARQLRQLRASLDRTRSSQTRRFSSIPYPSPTTHPYRVSHMVRICSVVRAQPWRSLFRPGRGFRVEVRCTRPKRLTLSRRAVLS